MTRMESIIANNDKLGALAYLLNDVFTTNPFEQDLIAETLTAMDGERAIAILGMLLRHDTANENDTSILFEAVRQLNMMEQEARETEYQIAMECELEGLPSNGEDYDLRVETHVYPIWKQIDDLSLDIIDNPSYYGGSVEFYDGRWKVK